MPRSSLRTLEHHRLVRALHPAAWWIWAIALACVASDTTNPLMLTSLICVLALVVANRRSERAWSKAFRYYLVLGAVIIAIRVVFRCLFGGGIATRGSVVLFAIPHLPLPAFAHGISVGGAITLNATLTALYGALSLATLICCIGAANALANPKRLLSLLPGAFYELGVAVVVAISFAPQLIESIERVRRARLLRGGATNRRHLVGRLIVPVLADGFERSLALAASMDARGYARRTTRSARIRLITRSALLAGLIGLCLGAYGLIDPTAPGALAIVSFVLGGSSCVLGIVLAGRGVTRTHYRPDRWSLPEWLVIASGVVPAVLVYTRTGVDASVLHPSTSPLSTPQLPLAVVLGLLCAACAAVLSPPRRRSNVRTFDSIAHEVLRA